MHRELSGGWEEKGVLYCLRKLKTPVANFLSTPEFSRITKSIPPRARIVTPDAPVNVVKNALNTIAAIKIPPGNQPKECLKKLISLSPALLSESINPVNVKRGIAGIMLPVKTV